MPRQTELTLLRFAYPTSQVARNLQRGSFLSEVEPDVQKKTAEIGGFHITKNH